MCTWEMLYHKHDLLRIKEWVCGKKKQAVGNNFPWVSLQFYDFRSGCLYQLHQEETVNHAEKRKMIPQPKRSLNKPSEHYSSQESSCIHVSPLFF